MTKAHDLLSPCVAVAFFDLHHEVLGSYLYKNISIFSFPLSMFSCSRVAAALTHTHTQTHSIIHSLALRCMNNLGILHKCKNFHFIPNFLNFVQLSSLTSACCDYIFGKFYVELLYTFIFLCSCYMSQSDRLFVWISSQL